MIHIFRYKSYLIQNVSDIDCITFRFTKEELLKLDKRELANITVKENLSRALFELLEKKNISEIGISELIERANVARASFYRNFSSLEEILQYELKSITMNYEKECPSNSVKYSDLDYMTWKFAFYKKYARKIMILKESGLASLLINTINQISLKDIDATDFTSESVFSTYFAAGAFYNVTMKWLESGAKESPADIAHLFCSLINKNF